MHCEERFSEIYGRDPEGKAFCPYRICPIGAHSDHNLGKITGLAINKGIHIAYAPKQNGVVEMASLQFQKRAQWHIASVPNQKWNILLKMRYNNINVFLGFAIDFESDGMTKLPI